MTKKKNKRIKSIRHRTTDPIMKKEKEPAKGGLSVRGKRVAHSPSPPNALKETPWFFEEHYEASNKFSYAKKEMIQPMLVWRGSKVKIFFFLS